MTEWFILQLYEMIRVLHEILSPIVFVLFYDRYWQGRALKLIKVNHFLVFSAVLVFFPKFLGRLMSGLY